MPTQTVNNTNLATGATKQLTPVPHPRTLRNAREQVKCMVADDASLHEIRVYLSRWLHWWTKTAGVWNRHELLQLFINNCHDKFIASIAHEILQHELITLLCKTESAGTAAVVAGLAA